MIRTIEWNGQPLRVDDEDRVLITDARDGLMAMMYIPGYNDIVMIPVFGKNGWSWDGDRWKPTFSPSILDPGEAGRIRNHVFVRDGVIEYLHDCGHELAGKMVELPKLADWPDELKLWND